MAKVEVSLQRKYEEGQKVRVYAERFGGNWSFFRRHKRYDQWKLDEAPPLVDWLELLDGVRRRMQRDLLPFDEDKKILKEIRERFPDERVK